MSEADSVVHTYLLSFSPKLAKQFSKKREITTPWIGPDLIKLIQFYKDTCKEEPAAVKAEATNGAVVAEAATVVPAQTNGKAKKGKKRKISVLDESVNVETPAVTESVKEKKKKKKKKGKAAEPTSPDVVEIIQDKEETPAPAETPTPAVDDTPEESAPAAVGGLVGEPMEEEEEEEEDFSAQKAKKKLSRKGSSNSSFRRVKEEDVTIKKAELADNTFEAKGGADGYGYKANQILKFTKGKSFRHEKTKKKRGTYKGGIINMGVTSIKFDSDSN